MLLVLCLLRHPACVDILQSRDGGGDGDGDDVLWGMWRSPVGSWIPPLSYVQIQIRALSEMHAWR